MDRYQVTLAVLRGAHVLALVSLFGALVSLTVVVPAASRSSEAVDVPKRDLTRLALRSAGAALLLGLLWVCMQAAEIGGARTPYGILAALRPVTLHTRFGHLMLMRGALLLATCVLLARRETRLLLTLALPLAALALAMQGFIGHAGAVGGDTGAMLLAVEALHLLAAGAWLGGLAPLFVLIGALPSRAASAACQAFSLVGAIAVALIAGTALEQSAQWIGGIGALFGTAYGRIALLKVALFLLLLVLAAANRFVLTARLTASDEAAARRFLRLSIAAEAVLGLLIILVAGFLASSMPATHEQPVWPFSRRPSLETLADPDGRSLLVGEALPFLVIAGLAVIGCFWRRTRWPSLAALAVILAFAASRMPPFLTVEAYPTSFASSTTGFSVGSIARGAGLFAANCTLCHGANGQGDGPATRTLPVRPADLTAPHFLAHSDGDLFWFIAHGMEASSGQQAMPGFSGAMASDGIWALIDYLHARHAGQSMRTNGAWGEVVAVPRFDAFCADGTSVDLDDLRGNVLRIIATAEDASPPRPSVGIVELKTILLARDRATRPTGSECVTNDPAAWTSFSILTGVAPDDLAGTLLLSDPDLWLRARWRPGDPGNWNDPQQLRGVIRDIVANPLGLAAGGDHAHHH